MDLMEMAKRDLETLLNTDVGFSLLLTFISPTGQELVIKGQFFDRTLLYEMDGQGASGNHAVVHVSEKPFIDAEYSIRNTKNAIDFKGHKITAKYADGTTRNFKAADWHPDYSINMITIQLQQYAS